MNISFFDYLNNSIVMKTLPHAFLVETKNIEELFNEIIKCLYEKKLLKKVDYINNLNFILIETQEKEIKKESILYLQERFSKHPVDNDYNIYIIKNAELLNGASSNKLLKFLEEPSSNTIGFLLIDYGTSVTKTIYSRCQHFIINKEDDKSFFDNETEEFIDLIIKNKSFKQLIDFKNKYNKYERKNLIIIAKNTLKTVEKDINKKIKINKNLSNNIILIDQILRLLESNVNIDLVLDKLLIELR